MRRPLVLIATAVLGAGVALGGQPLHASASSAGTGHSANGATVPTPTQILGTAQQYLGYPYAYIGDQPSSGFSCIGFVHYIFAQHGVYVPEDLARAYISAPQVDQKDLQPGDLIFFQNTVWDGISHVDVYMGDGKMIGADTFQTGVQWDTLSDPYWQEHYLGATRPLSDPTGTPIDSSTSPAPTPAGPTLAPPSGPSLAIKTGTTLPPRHPAPIYSGPGDSYMSIDTVTPATTLTVMQTHGQWANVSYDDGGQFGWIRGSDLATSAQSSGDNSGTAQDSSTSNTAPVTSTNTITATSPATSGATTPAPRVAAGASAMVASQATVYSGPTSSDQVLSHLAIGTRVTVLQVHGSWAQITLPDQTIGWIDAASLSATGSASGSTAGSSSGTGASQQVAGFHATRAARRHTLVVTAGVLFVRATGRPNARILRRVHAGDRVQLLRTRRNWDYVSLRDGSRGWVSALWVQ